MNTFLARLDGLRSGSRTYVLALVLGALMPLGLAPLTWWPVAILALGVFAQLLPEQSPRRAARLCFAFGMGLWLHGGSWLLVSMHDYGSTSWPLAIAMLMVVAAIMATLFYPLGWLYGRLRFDHLNWLVLPVLFAFGEWLRSWLLTGFPWLMMGYGFIDTPLAGWAPIFGIYGVSIAAAVTATALFSLLRLTQNTSKVDDQGDSYSAQRSTWRLAAGPLIALLISWGGGALLNPVSWTHIDKSKAFSVSLIQGDIPQEDKWALEWRDKTVDIYRTLSHSEWGQDLVLWPEAAIPMFAHEAQDVLASIENDALKGHSAFVTGIPFATWNSARTSVLFYNSIAAMGEGFGLYHKQQLVPIGEYIPFEDWLRGTIPFFNLPMSSFTWGARDQRPLVVKDLNMAPFICYEIAYPSLVQRMSKPADFLATISNDGWFGHSIGPVQHFQMVRMRAKETGRYIVRGTNNGITAFIDEHGNVVSEAPHFTRTVLRGVIYPAAGLTPWQRAGVYPFLAFTALVLLLASWRARQRRQ